MQNNTRTRKIISLLVSAIMVLSMIPAMALASFAQGETLAVYESGNWLVPGAAWNTNMDGFSTNGAQPAYSTIGLYATRFVFMQTVDNQPMTYTVEMYGKKNAITNSAKIMWLETNYNNSADDFMDLVTSEYWSSDGTNLTRWQNGSTFPQDVDMTSYGTPGKMVYTVTFNANGSAVYHPEWSMQVRTRASGFSDYTNYEMSALNYDGNVINADPVFTIQVIDMRELITLVSIASSLNINVSDIVNGRDLSGNTYYSQETVDTMVSALRTRLLCDYSALDTQLARAAQIEDNIDGGLGGRLYDETLYGAFESVYSQALAFDRFLMGNAESENQASINAQALALKDAIDNLLPSRIALVSYYVDGVLYGQNTVDPADGYNLHDATHKRGDEYYVYPPTKEHYEFVGWADVNGNLINENAPITSDLDVYAKFTVKLNGIAPLSSSGRWDHVFANSTDPNGDYYMWGDQNVTMWVNDTDFNFMQVEDGQVFSFYSDFTAYKNLGNNYGRIDGIYLVNDTETNEFADLLAATNGIEVYCVTPNFGNGDMPSSDDTTGNGEPDGLLPGIFANNHASQASSYFVTWRYIYAFNADGAKTYHPKWNVYYTSGGQNVIGNLGATSYDLTQNGDTYVNFTINVSDARGLIKMIDKAESILNNANNNFDDGQKAAIRAIIDDIKANYVLDGSVYYDQTTINTQIERIRNYIPESYQIPCDYTELDAAIALADAKMAECNNNANNHYIAEVWTDFENAYAAATDPSIRGLYIDGVVTSNNQTTIDNITAELLRALNALEYKSHVNEHTDDDDLQDLIDDAIADIGTDNSNGLYDDDVWQDYIDALDHAQDVIDQDLYIDTDGGNDNQQTIDDALQELQDAIDALNNPANQNDPCDYSALNQAIADAQAIGDNADHQYTAATYEALQDAIAAGQAVPSGLYDDDAGVNQGIIDAAAQAITDALNALTENNKVDTTALEDAVDDAENNDPGLDNSNGQYTDDAWQDYLDALDDANDIINNPPYDDENGEGQQAVDDALQALEDAIAALNDPANQNDPCDYSALDQAIADAQAIGNNADHQYTAATYEALQDAIAAGQAVDRDLYDDENGVNQGIIDAAAQAITDALVALTENNKVDTTALEDAVADAENNTPGTDNSNGQYTDDAWQDYLDALDDANDLINNPPYDDENGEGQQAVDDALQALEDAIAALNDPANQNDPCDYSALEDAMSAAQSINDSSLFTDPTYQALLDAFSNAENVDRDLYDDENGVNQGIIDGLTDALLDAIDALLAEAIERAQDVSTEGMTQDSINDLDDAITAAESVAADTTASAQDKADAINGITDAVDGLAADKTDLELAIYSAGIVDTTDVPQNLIDALDAAVTNGETVYADDDASVQDVEDATEQIRDAIADILQSVIDSASNTDTTGMTGNSVQDLQDAIDNAQSTHDDVDSSAYDLAQAIADVQNAVESLEPDKTELEETIAAGEQIISNIDLPQNIEDALQNAINDAIAVDSNPDATVQDIQEAIDAINDIIDQILQDAITDANNTDTSAMDSSSVQDLQDAIADAEAVAGDPNSTAQEKADALDDLQNALENLTPDKSELEAKIAEGEAVDTTPYTPESIKALEDAIQAGKDVDSDSNATVAEIAAATQAIVDAINALAEESTKLIPTTAGGLYVNRTDSSDIILEGLGTDDTSVSAVRAKFENDSRQILFYRNGVLLDDGDLVGTGCVVKCVSVKDPTVVYEQATIILYGDVNGDGLINGDDYDLMLGEAIMGVSIDGKYFRIAGDINNDGVIDGFDMAQTELEWTGAKKISQIGRSLRADVTELNVTSVNTEGGAQSVDTAVRFTAVETETEILAKEYRNWNVDFAVSFNKDVNGSDVSLYGQYDAYGADWVGGALSDGQIAAGEKVYLINDWINGTVASGSPIAVNYTDIVTVVREMNTAIRVQNPESGLTVTVDFVLTDPVSGNSYTAATYTYTY